MPAGPGGYVMQNGGRISLLGGGWRWLQVTSIAPPPAKSARIIRKNASGVEETVLDLKQVLEGRAPDPELHPEELR